MYTLINTAGSVSNSQQYFESTAKPANGLLITPEDGDIRISIGLTPTSSLGMLLSSGTKYYLPLIDLSRLKLIRTGGSNVLCSIDLFFSDLTDVYAAVAEKVSIEADTSGLATSSKQDTQITQLASLIGFDIPEYDYISLSYTGTDLTGVVFKTGGSGGSTVRTLTLAYTGSDLTSVTAS